jgi:hypothetical protein
MKLHTTLGWIGTALQIFGAAALASRLMAPRDAYLAMLLGAAIWCEVAARRRIWSLLAMQLVFVALNVIGLWRWWHG